MSTIQLRVFRWALCLMVLFCSASFATQIDGYVVDAIGLIWNWDL
jgi:hypothetical protein